MIMFNNLEKDFIDDHKQALVFGLGIIVGGMSLFVGLVMSGHFDRLSKYDELEKKMMFVIQKHNEANHENNRLKTEIKGLRWVNKRLIEDCDNDDVDRVIRKTKLPPMVGC